MEMWIASTRSAFRGPKDLNPKLGRCKLRSFGGDRNPRLQFKGTRGFLDLSSPFAQFAQTFLSLLTIPTRFPQACPLFSGLREFRARPERAQRYQQVSFTPKPSLLFPTG